MIEGEVTAPAGCRIPATIWGVIVLMTAIELVLSGADLDLWGASWWRPLTYEYTGFWPGLLGNWKPNYLAQPYAMFVTYGFVHAGLWHLAVNTVTLVVLTPPSIARLGAGRFYLLYGLSLFGGAAGYALLNHAALPMVGCSGALFGLAGALLSLDLMRRFHLHLTLLPVLVAIAALIAGNAVSFWAASGQLAWQAHLGGFVTGWLFAIAVPCRQPRV